MTTFHREEFTRKAIALIHERTEPGTFQLHIFDNNSGPNMQTFLLNLLNQGLVASLHLDSRNTGCLYNKGVFHMMTEQNQEYYVVSDNDIYPPKLSPDWLSQMIRIMDAHPELAFLTPQCPPQWLSGPYDQETQEHKICENQVNNDIIYCKAVGNILKLVRRKAFPLKDFRPALGIYGDDSFVCDLVRPQSYESAFCRNIFAFHAGQCENWGYKEKEIALDPRKAGYGKPFKYELANEETFEPILLAKFPVLKEQRV